MSLKQLSIFLHNSPRQTKPFVKLGEAGINILSLQLADTQEFGILRLVVDDWEKAVKVLEADGQVVKVTDVIALEIPHRPGGLSDTLGALVEESDVNIEYMYGSQYTNSGTAAVILRFTDPEKVVKILMEHNIRMLETVEDFTK